MVNASRTGSKRLDAHEALRAIVALAESFDAAGAMSPKTPLSWESVARIALDLARSVLAQDDSWVMEGFSIGIPSGQHYRIAVTDAPLWPEKEPASHDGGVSDWPLVLSLAVPLSVAGWPRDKPIIDGVRWLATQHIDLVRVINENVRRGEPCPMCSQAPHLAGCSLGQ